MAIKKAKTRKSPKKPAKSTKAQDDCRQAVAQEGCPQGQQALNGCTAANGFRRERPAPRLPLGRPIVFLPLSVFRALCTRRDPCPVAFAPSIEPPYQRPSAAVPALGAIIPVVAAFGR